MIIKYFIYDSRYNNNSNKAIVLLVCDSLREARREKNNYGEGNVIVKVTINKEGEIIKEEKL